MPLFDTFSVIITGATIVMYAAMALHQLWERRRNRPAEDAE